MALNIKSLISYLQLFISNNKTNTLQSDLVTLLLINIIKTQEESQQWWWKSH